MENLSLKTIAKYVFVIRCIIDEIKKQKGPVVEEFYKTLELANAFIEGEKISKKEIQALKAVVSEHYSKYGIDDEPVKIAVYWITGALLKLQLVITTGKDVPEILEHSQYSIKSLLGFDWKDSVNWIEKKGKQALEKYKDISTEPLSPVTGSVSPNVDRAEKKLLKQSRQSLPEETRFLLDIIGAECDARLHGNQKQLNAILEKYNYISSRAVINFEESFGGLLIPNPGQKNWREENHWGLVGAYGCLKQGGDISNHKDNKFIPVWYGRHDDIGFLDEKGQCYLQFFGEEMFSLQGDGSTLIACLMALELVYHSSREVFKAFIQKAPGTGEKVAAKLNLGVITNNPVFKMWIGTDILVIDFEKLYISAFSDTESAQIYEFI